MKSVGLICRLSIIFLNLAVLRAGAAAPDFSFTPATVRQGETLQLHATTNAVQARMNGITIPLFPQPDGTMFGLMPVPVAAPPRLCKLEFLDKTGLPVRALTVTVRSAHYAKQNIVISPQLSTLRASTEEADTVRAFLKSATPTRYWLEPFQLPVPGCLVSPFGVRRFHNGRPTGDYHGGLDQRGVAGAEIHAATAGVVRIARMFQLRGGTVAIDHGQGLETIYMHMSKIAAKEGQQVAAGDVIGYVGSTGRATGPHLHWSVYANGRSVSPGQWVRLPPPCTVTPAGPKKRRKRPA